MVMRFFAVLAIVAAALGAQTAAPTAMAESSGAGNLPTHKIGPNDLIVISVYDAPEVSCTARVGADGVVFLPLLKKGIEVAGLEPLAVEARIADTLKAEEILVDPLVRVTVAEYQSRPISVVGAVRSPLTFQAVGSVTLLEAITRAGGLAENAGPDILITRAAEDPTAPPLTRRVSALTLIKQPDAQTNVVLEGGEEIRVPEVGKGFVYVVGNVRSPGAIPIQENAQTTVLKALAVTGGLAPYAGKQAYLIRFNDKTGVRDEIPVELRKIMDRKSADVTLVADDIFYVTDNSRRRNTLATLEKVAAFGSAVAVAAIIYGVFIH
jgi:polysaccharide export outer membrane protein